MKKIHLLGAVLAGVLATAPTLAEDFHALSQWSNSPTALPDGERDPQLDVDLDLDLDLDLDRDSNTRNSGVDLAIDIIDVDVDTNS